MRGPDHLLVVRRRRPRLVVVGLLGTPLWQAGPTLEHAMGAFLITFGPRLGIRVVDDAEPWVEVIRKAGRCAVPITEDP